MERILLLVICFTCRPYSREGKDIMHYIIIHVVVELAQSQILKRPRNPALPNLPNPLMNSLQ